MDMEIKRYILVFLGCIPLIHGKFCEMDKSEYFQPQSQQCLKCDRCPLGMGRASKEAIDFEIHPIHGALGCLSCIDCKKGVSFSNTVSHKECKSCRNCSSEDLLERKKCTPKTNTKCRRFRQLPDKLPVQDNVDVKRQTDTGEDKITDTHEGGHDIASLKTIFGAVVGVVLVISSILIASAIYIRRNNCKRRAESNQTCYRDVLSGTSHSYPANEGDALLDIDGTSCKPVLKADQPSLSKEEFDYRDHVPSEQELQSFASRTATRTNMYIVGRNLGLETNTIDRIMDEYSGVQEQSFRTYLKWMQRHPMKATCKDLFLALKKNNETSFMAEVLLNVLTGRMT